MTYDPKATTTAVKLRLCQGVIRCQRETIKQQHAEILAATKINAENRERLLILERTVAELQAIFRLSSGIGKGGGS